MRLTPRPCCTTRCFSPGLDIVDRPQSRRRAHSPWTNGKIEAFWATLKSEVLDREVFRSLADAEAALERFARYYNYHRLHGEIGWLTPGERYDGTPFTDRGFENIPALAHLAMWLDDVRKAA